MDRFDTKFKEAGKRKVVVEVDYNEVDDLITRNFPNMNGRYEIIAYEEWGNHQDHSFNITGVVDECELKKIYAMMQTRIWPHYNTGTILEYLCSLGIIEPAEYLITVFW